MQNANSNLTPAPVKDPVVEDILQTYQMLSGSYDEMCAGTKQIRPHWQYLMNSLHAMGHDELERRWQEGRRLLRDNGVTYNVYGDPQGLDRPWQLDPIPHLISSEEWGHIERGLIQRAELMSLLLADLYGARDTIRKGLLPVELVASHPGFLRAIVGVSLPKRHRLPLYAVDLARSATGEIWAIADRTQAPSGAGYALENRLVISRILPSLFRDSHVHRLALFFRTLRQTLASMSPHEDPRIVVLTPGPANETYFEHAYLAKYLGYTLVQGADLTVRDGKVALKTLDGLQPVDVILRRVDDSACDPLELRPDSYLGVAGLTQAVRMGGVSLANPLGCSVLENAGLYAFLPNLAKYFLGEELDIPSPQTWWCGDKTACNHVLANIDKLVIKRIANTPGHVSVRGRLLSSKQRDLLRAQILAQPNWYVGGEEIFRSTTPVLVNGHVEPRQLVLRSFLVTNENNYVVMPGGLTRVAASADSPVVSAQSGGLSKDTWVIASEPERELTLIPETKKKLVIFEGHGQGELPSRVAENMFWLGRYAERAEGVIRLLRAVLLYLADPYDFVSTKNHPALPSLLRAVTYLTETLPGFVGEGAEQRLDNPREELLSVFLDRNRAGSLASTLQFLLNAARSTRDRLSPDMWRVFSAIEDELNRLQQQAPKEINEALQVLDNIILWLSALEGLSVESMTHGQGWRFLIIGRRLERCYNTGQLLRATLSTVNEDEAVLLENLLVVTDSLLTYRRRYRSYLQVNATLELLLQNELNPRSIGYQLEQLSNFIATLRNGDDTPYRAAEERVILEALTQVRLADVDALAIFVDGFRKDLDQLLVRLWHLIPALSDAITNSYFSHAEQPRQLVKLEAEHEDNEL
ncbi:circularly permuted type 2 ATP-grasp protein [Beggiatoa leptomitoformis]|uniref:Uncharacterized protein n=1 Tax=Beggiatoa leptomitoformis TaxID=288004 RepID=A0A2N9YJA4_9GAMM|nr:circularly permuted type 2 ATP-grasp protein [Beggiatoa leptomitoformis]ALG69493.2 hypothetical protein AL038_13280 [Beggiatoa leptomitoformis]AUI70602.2 hypothetical protein BLE401_10985 [Beggiatoa leptomitoformis]